MVELTKVVESNQQITSNFPRGITAVFVGGTSGIGEYTLRSLSKYTPHSKIYIVGRSQEAADHIIKECSQETPSNSFVFIPADISVLRNVDDVCHQILRKETSINLLCLSQGTMAFEKVTNDGFPLAVALGLHSRLRFIMLLLPLLQSASGIRRIVSICAGTCEGAIDLSNIYGTGFALRKWRDQLAALNTLSYEEISTLAPDVSIVHTVPGVVESKISRDAQGFGIKLALLISKVLQPLIATSPAEVAERTVFAATSAAFPPASPTGQSLWRSIAITTIYLSGMRWGGGYWRLQSHRQKRAQC